MHFFKNDWFTMKMSPIANVKYCLEAACLSMLKQTRSPDVANCSNFHLVWVSWWTSVAPGTQNCQTWKKININFFTYDRNLQIYHFWLLFHYSRQKFNKKCLLWHTFPLWILPFNQNLRSIGLWQCSKMPKNMYFLQKNRIKPAEICLNI